MACSSYQGRTNGRVLYCGLGTRSRVPDAPSVPLRRPSVAGGSSAHLSYPYS